MGVQSTEIISFHCVKKYGLLTMCEVKIYHLLTKSEVITGKFQTAALMSDSEVNTSRLRSEISL